MSEWCCSSPSVTAGGGREVWVLPSYTRAVKVAVSIPDAVFEAAEELAARRQCSRSSLYAQALERLLAAEDRDEVTARLDAVYAEEPSELDPALRDAQARALAERW